YDRKNGGMGLEEIRTTMSRSVRDRGPRNTYCALHLSRQIRSNRCTPRLLLQATTQSRSVLACCREWAAESRAFRLLFSCSPGIRPAPGELRSAPGRRGFARPCAATRRVRFVAAPAATVFLRAAPLLRSRHPAPAPPRIRWRFAVREHFPATNNRATSEKHPVKRPAPVCRVVEKIA